MDDVLNDALSNLEHDNYERSHKGYENRQADIALIRTALAAKAQPDAGLDVEAVLRQFLTGDGFIAECDIQHIVAALTAHQPAISGYACTVPDDCETLHWRGQILSMNELVSVAQPFEGEEIMVNTPYDVYTLPLQPSGLTSGPRFVVHVPGAEAQADMEQGGGEAAPPSAPVGVPSAKTLASVVWSDWMANEQADRLGDALHKWLTAYFAQQPAARVGRGSAGGAPINVSYCDGNGAVRSRPAEQQPAPPNDPLQGIEYREDGEANFYTLSKPRGSWLARIQFNGELRILEQERLLEAMLGDRNVRYGDGYHDGYWKAKGEAPDVSALVEALKEIRSRSSMNLAMNPNPYALTALLGDIHQIADAALAQESKA